jgi:putative PIN family toxin of toxin-antitoxin system
VIRVTLDVNVLASGFPAEAGTPSDLIQRWTNLEYELVLSAHILEGLERTWQKPYYQLRYSSQRVGDALSLLRTAATIVVPATTVSGVGEDEEDDLVLATALAGNADFLVTGDKHLQSLNVYRGVMILSPRQFLDVLQSERW